MDITATIGVLSALVGADLLSGGLQILPDAALLPPPAPTVARAEDRAWSEMQDVGAYQPVAQPFPLLPTRPTLLLLNGTPLGAVQRALYSRYPATQPVTLLHSEANSLVIFWQGALDALPATLEPGEWYAFLPALDPLSDLWSADGPTTVITRLLGPYGCPWDREQTHRSLRKDLLGETHEVLEAIDEDDPAALGEELGDLLLQVLLHAEIGRQAGEFSLNDVYHHLATKLIRRHPHVFGDVQADTSDTVLRNWETIKQAERAEKGQKPRGTLDGIPPTLPALAQAQATLKKAAKAGFYADEIGWDWAKLREEIDELEQATQETAGTQRDQHIVEEYGDALLILTRLAMRLGLDAESALREATGKFRQRFGHVERLASERGQPLLTIDEAAKIALWNEAKGAVNGQ